MKLNQLNLSVSILAASALMGSAFCEEGEGERPNVFVDSGVWAGGPEDCVVDGQVLVESGQASFEEHDTLILKSRANDGDGGPVNDPQAKSKGIVYEVTISGPLKEGQYFEAQGTADIEGDVSAELTDCHGYAEAGATSLSRVTLNQLRAEAKGAAIVAIAHEESSLIGGGVSIAGFGGTATATVLTSGDEAAVDTYADPDATPWTRTDVGMVKAGWDVELKTHATKPGLQSKPAYAAADGRAYSQGSITWKKGGTADIEDPDGDDDDDDDDDGTDVGGDDDNDGQGGSNV